MQFAAVRDQWDAFADPYTRWTRRCPEKMLDVLAALAAGRAAIELGAGAGRVCIPLAEHGITTTAVDFSPVMLGHLRAVAANRRLLNLEIIEGNFSMIRPSKSFGLAYAVDNTFFALTSEKDQLRCFHSVSRLLEKDGFFVLEANTPTPNQLASGVAVRVNEASRKVIEYFKTQRARTTSVVTEITEETRTWALTHCYVSVKMLDEFACISGFHLYDRWVNWDRKSYDGNPWRHVSVWRL